MILRHAARLICAIGFLVSFIAPRAARAEDDATVEMARQRFREGVQFYDQHQYEKARLAFLQAYALKAHPAVLLNLAQSELRSGHPDEAASHFSEYLRSNAGASEADKQETELGFTTAKSRVGEVMLTVDSPGAQVLVDGTEKGATPLPGALYVLPGAHAIEVRLNDRHASKSVTVGAGQSVSVALSLHGAMAAAGAPPTAESENPAPPEPPAQPLPETRDDQEKPAQPGPHRE